MGVCAHSELGFQPSHHSIAPQSVVSIQLRRLSIQLEARYRTGTVINVFTVSFLLVIFTSIKEYTLKNNIVNEKVLPAIT